MLEAADRRRPKAEGYARRRESSSAGRPRGRWRCLGCRTGAGLRRWLAMWQGDAGSRSWNAPGVLRGLSPPARGLRTIALVVAAGARAQRAGGGLGDDAEARSAAAPPRGEHAARARADPTATRRRDPRELGPRRGYWAFHGVRPGVVASPSQLRLLGEGLFRPEPRGLGRSAHRARRTRALPSPPAACASDIA